MKGLSGKIKMEMRKKASHIFLQHRRIFIFCFYTVMVTFSFYASFLLRFDFHIPALYEVTFYSRLPIFWVIKLGAFGVFALYSGMWRDVTSRDILDIVKANTAALLIFATVEEIFFHFPKVFFSLRGNDYKAYGMIQVEFLKFCPVFLSDKFYT